MYRSRSYSSMRSRAINNQRAADQQRDQTQVVLKTTIVRGGGQTDTLLDDTDPHNEKNSGQYDIAPSLILYRQTRRKTVLLLTCLAYAELLPH